MIIRQKARLKLNLPFYKDFILFWSYPKSFLYYLYNDERIQFILLKNREFSMHSRIFIYITTKTELALLINADDSIFEWNRYLEAKWVSHFSSQCYIKFFHFYIFPFTETISRTNHCHSQNMSNFIWSSWTIKIINSLADFLVS